MTPTWDLLKVWWTPEQRQRFWAKVNTKDSPSGCWIWTGNLTDSGYGLVYLCGGYARVHRITWMLARERDIPEWMKIRHWACDTAPCCNPAHLIGGTPEECSADRKLLRLPFEASAAAIARGADPERVHILDGE